MLSQETELSARDTKKSRLVKNLWLKMVTLHAEWSGRMDLPALSEVEGNLRPPGPELAVSIL